MFDCVDNDRKKHLLGAFIGGFVSVRNNSPLFGMPGGAFLLSCIESNTVRY